MNVLKQILILTSEFSQIRAWPAVGDIIRQEKKAKLNDIINQLDILQKQFEQNPDGILEEYIAQYGRPFFIGENGPNKLNNPAVNVFIKNNSLSVEN